MSNKEITKIYRHQYDTVSKKVNVTYVYVSGTKYTGERGGCILAYLTSCGKFYADLLGHLQDNYDGNLPVMYDSKPNPTKYIELLIENQAKVVKASREKYEEDNKFLEGLKTFLGETIHRPCPYCGKNEGELHKKTEGVPEEKFYVSCNGCGAQTHSHSNEKDAINEWNTGSCR